jgi:hypothetical protein
MPDSSSDPRTSAFLNSVTGGDGPLADTAGSADESSRPVAEHRA